MKHLLRRIALSATLVLVAATTFIGAVIEVQPAIPGGLALGHAVAYCDATQEYLSVTTGLTMTPAMSSSIRASSIDPLAGTAGSTATIWTGTTAVFGPSLSWNDAAGKFLLVATGTVDGTARVVGLVLGPDGAPVGGATMFPINTGDSPTLTSIRVATDGTRWLVTWGGGEGGSPATFSIRGRFVEGASTNATPSFAAPPFVIAPAWTDYYDDTALTFSPAGGFFMIWERAPYQSTPTCLEGCLISTAGVVGELRRYLTGAPERSGLVVAPSPDGYVGGWADYSVRYLGRLSLMKFDSAGAALGAPQLVHESIYNEVYGTGRIDPKSITMAWNAPSARYLLAWTSAPIASGPSARMMALTLPAGDFLSAEPPFELTSAGIPTNSNGPLVAAATPPLADSTVVVQWAPPFGTGTGEVSARICDLAGIRAPSPPSVSQYRKDGVTPIAAGGATNETAFVVRSTLRGTAGSQLRLEVDVAETGSILNGSSIHGGSLVTTGSVATTTVVLPGFAPGKSYHWRARTVDAAGGVSRWVDFAGEPDITVRATNVVPAFASIGQFRHDGVEIPEGGALADRTVVIRSLPIDGDGDDLQLDIELRPTTEPLIGQPTASAPAGPSGRPAEITVDLSSAPDGSSYHWQARVTDSMGTSTPWTVFGGTASDFAFLLYGSSSPNSCHGTVAGIAQGGMALAALLLLGFRKR